MPSVSTYFVVRYWVDRKLFCAGPYADPDYARTMMMDVIPELAASQSSHFRFRYRAELAECVMSVTGWQVVRVHLSEGEELCSKR
jgi:hypothetical protein